MISLVGPTKHTNRLSDFKAEIKKAIQCQKFKLGKRSELHLFRGIKLSGWVPVLRGNPTCPMW